MQLDGKLFYPSPKSVRVSIMLTPTRRPFLTLNIRMHSSTLAPLISVAPSDPSMRSSTLEYISRVAISDVPKESIQSLLALCVETLQSSHEEDGALAQQIVSDVFKAYKSLEDLSTPYLQWLVQLFGSIPAAATKYIVGSGTKSKFEEPIQASCSIKLSQDIAMSTFRWYDLSSLSPPWISCTR